jgi:hypothetical protein
MNKHLIARMGFAAVLAFGSAIVVTGCGDDEEEASGDCSACPSSFDCSGTFKECKDQGGTAKDCQDAIDVICALTGDSGLSFGGSGGSGGGSAGGGSGGAADGG